MGYILYFYIKWDKTGHIPPYKITAGVILMKIGHFVLKYEKVEETILKTKNTKFRTTAGPLYSVV
jgi:hypothetical protein